RVNPPKKFCIFHNLILARAILSWNVPPPPNDPGYDPVWGNVHDTHIQAEHFRLIILHDFYKAVDLEVPPALKEVVDLKQAVPAAKKKLSVAELAKLYAGKKVEPHRFAFQAIQQLVSAVPDEPQAAADVMDKLPGLDVGKVLETLEDTDGDTSYEELECVGLNTNQDHLVGVIRVKRPYGYSG
ncbi:MAG: hypothetical protein GY778_27955, partial [bacterium]|nr:hypothetical protein [bacterium]